MDGIDGEKRELIDFIPSANRFVLSHKVNHNMSYEAYDAILFLPFLSVCLFCLYICVGHSVFNCVSDFISVFVLVPFSVSALVFVCFLLLYLSLLHDICSSFFRRVSLWQLFCRKSNTLQLVFRWPFIWDLTHSFSCYTHDLICLVFSALVQASSLNSS